MPLGFQTFLRFTAEHPARYGITRQAEPVWLAALRKHDNRIVAAWALMGIGELVGMRWVLWDDTAESHHPSSTRSCASSSARSERATQPEV